MEIENSYEGAVRRLARLSHAGVDLLPSRRDDEEAAQRDRMRDLEQLANLATEENERLEAELARAHETIARLEAQVSAADRQRLRDLLEPPVRERRPLPIGRWLTVMVAASLAVATTITLRPWQYAPQASSLAHSFVRRHAVSPWAMPLEGAPQPIAAAVIEPPAPRIAPLPPPVVVPAPEPVVAKKRGVDHHAKRHHHAASAKAKPAAATVKSHSSDADPLLGL
jgi:hypothetical protein